MNILKSIFGEAPYDSIDVEQYEADYFKQKNHMLIDVRTPNEFKSGHIPGAKNFPLNNLSDSLKKIPQDKTVVVVCQSGNRSKSASKILTNAGYENIINLKGGTMRWRMSGKTIKK